MNSQHVRPRILTVATYKGGVGKTTASIGLASEMASRGLKVLLVDMDNEGDATDSFDLDLDAPGSAALLRGERPEFQSVSEGLDLLAGNEELLERAISRIDIEELGESLANLEYDACVLDTPGDDNDLTRMSLVAADKAAILTDAHKYGLRSAIKMMDWIVKRQSSGRPCPREFALVASKIDSRRGRDKDLGEQLKELHDTVFKLSQSVSVSEASNLGLTPHAHDPKGKAVSEYSEVIDWFLK